MTRFADGKANNETESVRGLISKDDILLKVWFRGGRPDLSVGEGARLLMTQAGHKL